MSRTRGKRATATSDEHFGSWEDAERCRLERSRSATPAQRLAWLEDALRLAQRSGALARERERRRAAELALWNGGSEESTPDEG